MRNAARLRVATHFSSGDVKALVLLLQYNILGDFWGIGVYVADTETGSLEKLAGRKEPAPLSFEKRFGMLLSDKTIKEYLERKLIQIYPDFNPNNIRPVGVRLHLGVELLIPKEGERVDLEKEQEVPFDRIHISDEGFVLKPNQFVLGSTYEKFQVPRNMVCHIEGRSTVARVGLAIHCTSGIIDGNFDEPRTIVLEIKNQGPFEIVLRKKMALVMLTFSLLSSEIEQAAQKQYQGQDKVLPPNLKLQKS